MKNNILLRILLATALLILAAPVIASAQIYERNDYYRYNRSSRQDVRAALNQLDRASARLQNDVNAGQRRTVLGGILSFRTVDNSAVDRVRDFRRVVRDLRGAARGGNDLDRSTDEARVVLTRGVELDRYLRLRTGRADVDADLAEIRSSLHTIADAYGMSMPYYNDRYDR
jgi:hypothetical protein